MKYLTKEHGRILDYFQEYPQGYVLKWHDKFKCNKDCRKWYFNFNDVKGLIADIEADSTVCEDLKDIGIIEPSLGDKEYDVQVALGTMNYRAYYMSDTMKNTFNYVLTEYLKENSIIWM